MHELRPCHDEWRASHDEWRRVDDEYLHYTLRAWEEARASDWAGGRREQFARLFEVIRAMALLQRGSIERAIGRTLVFLVRRILREERRVQVQLPPGYRLRVLAEFLFSRKTYSMVLEPTLTDLQEEYFKALAEHRSWSARMVRLRGYWSFWAAVLAQLPVAAIKVIVKLWKLG